MFEHPSFPWYVLAKTEGGDRVMRLLALNAYPMPTARYRCDIHDLEVDAEWRDGHLVISSEDWVDSIYDLRAAGTCPVHSLHEISYAEWKGRTSASPRHLIADIGDWNDMQEYPSWQEGYEVPYHTYKLSGRPGYELGERVRDLARDDNRPYVSQVYQSVCRFNTSVPWESPTLWIKLTVFGYGTVFDPKATQPTLSAADELLAELRMRVDSFRLS